MRNFCHITIHILGKQLTLVLKYSFQNLSLLIKRLCTVHSSIMHTTHTNRIKYRLMSHILYSIFPKTINIAIIMYIVILPAASTSPFAVSITCHGFTVRTSYINAILRSHFPITIGKKERNSTFMHSRPKCISTQSEQQLEYARISLGSNTTRFIPRLVV